MRRAEPRTARPAPERPVCVPWPRRQRLTRPSPRPGCSRRRSGGVLASAAFLPVPALLQRVDDLARHVILIMLGEHARGGEDAIRAQLSFGDGPLALRAGGG